MGPHWMKGSKRELLRAVLSLLNSGRGHAAQNGVQPTGEVPTKLIYRILDSIMEELSCGQTETDLKLGIRKRVRRARPPRGCLRRRGSEKRIRVFSAPEYGNRPLRLHKVMASDPAFYHHLLCLVFLGKHEETPDTEPTQADRARAQMSYSLLSKFTQVPGQSANGIDNASLARWIDRLCELAASSDRSEVAELYIGHILAHSIHDRDGGWPHRVVRDEIERLSSEFVETGIQIDHSRCAGRTGNRYMEAAARNADLRRRTASMLKRQQLGHARRRC